MEPRYNEPIFNVALGITTIFVIPVSHSKIYEKEARFNETSLFAVFTETIMHLVYPPKFCITILLDITLVPREIEENGYAEFWEANNVHYGLCENGE